MTKIVFQNIGLKPPLVNKTVEIAGLIGTQTIQDFALLEAKLHLPEKEKNIELVACDGLDYPIACNFVIVYGGLRGVGTIKIYP